jgi:integrase/recombinase XerD
MNNIVPIAPASITDGATPLSQNPAAVFLTTFASKHSRRTMQTALNTIADLLQPPTSDVPQNQLDPLRCLTIRWQDLRYQHTVAIRSLLMERYSPATANKLRSALRGVLKQSWRLGLMSAEDYQRAADVDGIHNQTLPAGRDLDSGEIRALVKVCMTDGTSAGARDAAIIGVLATGGLRRSEVVKLDFGDFDTSTGKLTIRGGKGGKDRTVYVTDGTQAAVEDWLVERGSDPGALFNPVLKSGRIAYRRMSDQAVYNLLVKRAQEAGVKGFSPHDFRRTFVGDMLDAGVDIVTVANLAGHVSITTTARYDRRPEGVKRAAAAKLHYPYQRRSKKLY